jgi:hypothetical protein
MPWRPRLVKLSVGVTCYPYVLEIEELFTQGWRPGQTVGESVGGILEMDSSDWSNGSLYHTIDTRPDTEFMVRYDGRHLLGKGRRGSHAWCAS